MRRHRSTRRLVVGILALSLGGAPSAARAAVTTFGCAGASSCTLAELFAGGAIQVNLTRFDNFELESIDPDGVQPNFALIQVIGRDDGGLDPGDGIEFSGNGQLQVADDDRLDMAVGFTVSEIPTNNPYAIVGNTLAITSEAVVGSAYQKIGEFVADGSGAGLGQKTVETDPAFAPPISSDAIGYPGAYYQLIVEKDILLQSAVAGDSAMLDRFVQRFALPEPPNALGLGAGAVGLWALHRLRARRYARRVAISST